MRLRRYSRPLRRHIYPTTQTLTTTLPDRPAALPLWHRGVAWAIGLDFDAKGRHSPATVAEHAADAAQLFSQLGGRVIVDTAASGGRHVWVPLSVPMSLQQAQHLARACRRLWPTLDISPTVNASEGCLTAPGSRCRDGAYRRLITPLHTAITAVTRRSHHTLIDRALTLLTTLVGPPDQTAHPTPTPSGGVTRPLSPLHTRIAEHGSWPDDRTTAHGQPWTRSEACYAVLCAAARRGYSQSDILHRIETGQWPGLLTLYRGRYHHHWRRRLTTEWTKALTTVSTHPTQAPQYTGGDTRRITESDFVRRWLATISLFADHLIPGRGRHNLRAVLWSLAWLAWRTGRRYIAAGTRSLARGCAGIIDHSTVATLLAHLRDLPSEHRPIRRISTGRGTHGDLYELVIPPAAAHLAADPATWPEPRPIPAVFGVRDPHRPYTKLLGATGWRIYQALTSGATGTAAQIAQAAGVSRAAAYSLLPVLTRLHLAQALTEPGTASGSRYQVGHHSTEQAGEEVDAPAHLARLDARHTTERAQWRRVLATYAERLDTATNRTPHPDEPLWWPPDWTTEPQPANTASPGSAASEEQELTSAVALLSEILGAELIST